MATVTAGFTPGRTSLTSPVGARHETLLRTVTFIACAAMVFQPILRPAGPGNSSPVDLLTVAMVLVSFLWAATCGRRLGAPYSLAGALLLLSGAVAGLAGPLPGTSLVNLTKESLLLAWCVALYNIARRPGVLRLLTAAFAYASVVWASVLVGATLAHITAVEGISPTEGDRKLFTLGDPNYAATYWVVSLFMVYAAQRPRARALRWYGYTMLLWALLLTQSNGGVLALCAGLVLLAAYTICRKAGPVAAAAIVLAPALVIGTALTTTPLTHVQDRALLSQQTELVNTLGRSGASTEQRGVLVRESLQLYDRQWLTGSGPGTTKQLLQDRDFPYAKEAHDDYLAALVERGPLGVVALLTLLMSAAWRSSRVLRAPPGTGFAAQVPRPAGLVAALLGLAVAGAYYEVLHFRFLWMLLAMVAVLATEPDPDDPYGRPTAEGRAVTVPSPAGGRGDPA
ncbi:O-antigen ligase family protein [Streptomyces sp. NBC_01478]|uniref:O-antigen ligase family protein n=1 Tax=Streptomyces sp. NBC_01478 TaxID=2903882 RepID=UPI002E2EFCD8|nr:O-antigen ligase family protein [Streptomyces sp. NBC_01478]